jgi:hypothetical protein
MRYTVERTNGPNKGVIPGLLVAPALTRPKGGNDVQDERSHSAR